MKFFYQNIFSCLYKIAFIAFFIFNNFASFSQTDSSMAHFAFRNEDKYEIRVDDKKVYTTNQFNLSNGKHTIEIWNAGFEVIHDTIIVVKEATNLFRYEFTISPDYFNYKKELQNFKLHKIDYIIAPSILTFSTVFTTIFYYAKGRKQYNNLVLLKENFYTSSDPYLLSAFDDDFKLMDKEYTKTRRFYYGFLGASVLSSTWAFFGIRGYKLKFKRPTNTYFESPFTKKNYALTFDLSPSGFQLTLDL
ncbi:MAG: hypothetical protein GQ574_03825 [Crocinitomix sp.]|nr:hypothetical protein [Crocinitomix sp.]